MPSLARRPGSPSWSPCPPSRWTSLERHSSRAALPSFPKLRRDKTSPPRPPWDVLPRRLEMTRGVGGPAAPPCSPKRGSLSQGSERAHVLGARGPRLVAPHRRGGGVRSPTSESGLALCPRSPRPRPFAEGMVTPSPLVPKRMVTESPSAGVTVLMEPRLRRLPAASHFPCFKHVGNTRPCLMGVS